MLLEDAHWIDPTSLEQFDLVVDRIRRLPVLLVVTFGRSSSSLGAATATSRHCPWTGSARARVPP